MFARRYFLIFIPIILAAFTHIWNPIGFPYPEFDEGIYMGRGVYLLQYHDLQDPFFEYDHPYFGNIFMASVFKMANYPDPNYFNLSVYGDENAIVMLFLISRLAMGVLAVVDAVLIYKIVERRYNNKDTALFASILFAVMPATWLTRWIHLDSIQLPFLLSSIVFALYVNMTNRSNHNLWIISLSGISLGFSIFTKVPAFTMIPLVGYLILSGNKSLRDLAIWFVPVILIPLVWPIYAIYVGEFNEWVYGVNGQLNREGWPLHLAIEDLLKIDPLLVILGIIGLAYASIRRDVFLILFTFPYLIFLYFINFVSNFHLLLLMVAFSISTSKLLISVINKIGRRTFFKTLIISVFAVFGLVSMIILITNGDNSSHLDALALTYKYIQDNHSNDLTIVASPFYIWLPEYNYKLRNYTHWSGIERFETTKILQILDSEFRKALEEDSLTSRTYHRIYQEFSIKNIANITDNKKDRVDIVLIDLADKKYDQNEGKKMVNLSSKTEQWKKDIHVKLSKNNENLTVFVNATDLKISGNRIRLNTTLNMTERPALLSLEYQSKTFSGHATFSVEIRDQKDLILWKKDLKYTLGKWVNELFILPDNVLIKPIKIIFNIRTQGIGEHQFVVNRGVIF